MYTFNNREEIQEILKKTSGNPSIVTKSILPANMQNWPTKENLYLEVDIMWFKEKKKVLGQVNGNFEVCIKCIGFALKT